MTIDINPIFYAKKLQEKSKVVPFLYYLLHFIQTKFECNVNAQLNFRLVDSIVAKVFISLLKLASLRIFDKYLSGTLPDHLSFDQMCPILHRTY